MKTIFLDFDGVLNNDRTTFLIKNYVDGNHVGFDQVNASVLNKFIKNLCTECMNLNLPADSNRHGESPCTECINIVICSTWRNFYTLSEMKGLLKSYLEDQWIDSIIDTTEVGLLLEREWSRADQVRSYIDKHNIEDYVVLDDESSYDEYPEMWVHWIKTSAYDGLTEEDIRKWEEKN